MRKKGITFLEILIAAIVMAVAMIPIFGMLSRQTVETDKNVTQAFAINKATEVLNFLLDNVSFVAIRAGNPGYLRVDDLEDRKNKKYSEELPDSKAKSWAEALFNNSKKENNGYYCKGTIEDSKGIKYLIYLKVEDIISKNKPEKPDSTKIGENYPNPGSAPNEHLDSNDVNFSYLKNPSTLTYNKWIQDYAETPEERNQNNKPVVEKEIGSTGVSEPSKNFYTDDVLPEIKGKTFSFKNPTSLRYTAKQVMNKVPYKVAEEGSAYCPFKRLIVQIQWNLDSKYYKDPENTKGNLQRVHLMAIKGDIDS
jgi:hypothetical protein